MESKKSTRVLAHRPALTPLSQKRSQVTIFVIIAILIIAVVVLIFFLRDNTKSSAVPPIFW